MSYKTKWIPPVVGVCLPRCAVVAAVTGEGRAIIRLEGRLFHLPDKSGSFLVDERMLLAATDSLGGEALCLTRLPA